MNNLKAKLNVTDTKGNVLAFDGRNLKITNDGKTNDIGFIEMVNGKVTYRKREREADRYRKLDAWSIPKVILDNVEWIQYQSDARAYEIAAYKARVYGTGVKAKVDLEEKVYVPVSAWTIFLSLDKVEQGRIEKFGVEWYNILHDVINGETLNAISSFLAERAKANKVYPAFKDLFKAFELTPFSKVKVVIVGNEPFEDEMADGLAFSFELPFAQHDIAVNISKELEEEGMQNMIDYKQQAIYVPRNWAAQGVLMLNQCLSVEKGHIRTHEGIGWEQFTERVIREIQTKAEPIVFMLLGTRAFEMQRFIDTNEHYVIKADASSPAFVGSNVFWECNGYLKKHGNNEIKW